MYWRLIEKGPSPSLKGVKIIILVKNFQEGVLNLTTLSPSYLAQCSGKNGQLNYYKTSLLKVRMDLYCKKLRALFAQTLHPTFLRMEVLI